MSKSYDEYTPEDWAAAQAATANNCTNPPHFPPHCGCPAG